MTYDDLVNDVVPECPGAPYPLVIRAIKEAYRTFCRDSLAYRKKLASADMTYASGVYTITAPTGFQIETVISPIIYNGTTTVYTFSDGSQSSSPTPPVGTYLVSTDNYTLKAIDVLGAAPEWLDINAPGWRTETSNTSVTYFAMTSPNTFQLTPDSGTDRRDNLTVSIILQPDRSVASPTLDDDFTNRWFDFLTAGAKYLLMVMPNVEWSNQTMSQFYKGKFEDGIFQADRYAKAGFRHAQSDGINHVRLHYR